MAGKLHRIGPVALTNVAANIFNASAVSGGVNAGTQKLRLVLRHYRIVNVAAAAHTYQLFIGATGASAAGTEFGGSGKSIVANGVDDWFGAVALDVTDFLTGLADANSVLTFEGEGEYVVI